MGFSCSQFDMWVTSFGVIAGLVLVAVIGEVRILLSDCHHVNRNILTLHA